jgi:hypothetical protein
MKIDLAQTILKLNPTAKVSITNDVYETIVWNDTPKIDLETILAKQKELQTNEDLKQYQRDRAKAYPSIEEQLDLQYWDKVNGTDTWEQAINAVKAQYPKS